MTLGLLAMLATACVAGVPTGDDDPQNASVCPPPNGEFPPTDCAIVWGTAKSPDGGALVGIPIRVDSVVGGGWNYSSNTVVTGRDGRFNLIVFRVDRWVPPTDPDTATVELKTYGPGGARPHGVAIARAPVLMYFAELGQPVTPTVVDAVFNLPAGR
jgi:hypothetical protein